MRDRVKVPTVAQDVIHMLKNTLREERNKVLTDFVVKLKMSGYRDVASKKALMDGIKGYNKMLRSNHNGLGKLHMKQ